MNIHFVQTHNFSDTFLFCNICLTKYKENISSSTSQVLNSFVNSEIYDYAVHTMLLISSVTVRFAAPVGDRQRLSRLTAQCQESCIPKARNIISTG
jgi:hypothetical protein